MQRPAAGAGVDLLPARSPWSNHNLSPILPDRRQQTPLGHLHRNFVVPLLVPEQPRHPATTGVNGLYVSGEAESLLRRPRANERLLVAVAVQQDRGAFPKEDLLRV